VKGLVWLGIPADDYAATARFFTGALGMDVAFDEGNTIELSAGNGDRVPAVAPGHRYFGLYRDQGARIVPLFEVEDLDEAHAGLIDGGAEIIGGTESDGAWEWLTFRGPDGNLYSVGARHHPAS